MRSRHGLPFRLLASSLLFAVASTGLMAQTVDSGPARPARRSITEGPAARMTPMRNTTEKEPRNYPEQPPLIPHSTEGYQVDINGNKCLSLPRPRPHRRVAGADDQHHPLHGPRRPVSRLGLAAALLLHPCHVPQHDVKAPVANDFVDIDTLLSRAAPGGRR